MWLEKRGFRVTFLGVDSKGLVDPGELEKEITAGTVLVSIMTANNETGTIQPVRELAGIAVARGVLFHTDAVQAFGKIPLNPLETGVDLMTISAHKIHGPRGSGALYISRNACIDEFISGGGHEFGLRPGTENTVGIAGFGRAADSVPILLRETGNVRRMRDRLEQGISLIYNQCRVNGHREKRLPNTLNMCMPGYRGESIVLEMNRRGIYFSAGSACGSGSPEPSHALTAMGLSTDDAHCSIRISLSPLNVDSDIDMFLKILEETIVSSRRVVHFVPCR